MELLVVITIIFILASIGIGGFHYYIQKAYNVTVKHDLKNFVGARKIAIQAITATTAVPVTT